MSEKKEFSRRLVWLVRSIDAGGFLGGAMLCVVLADQVGLLAMPKAVFWVMNFAGALLVVLALSAHKLIEDTLKEIEQKSGKQL